MSTAFLFPIVHLISQYLECSRAAKIDKHIIMNASPLRSLVSRHVCACKTVYRPSSRLLSTTLQRQAQFNSSIPTYGSAELLRRRYQPAPESVKDERAARARMTKRMRWSGYGIVLCALALFGTVYTYPDPRKEKNQTSSTTNSSVLKLDAPPTIPGVPDSASEDVEQIPTGTSKIPYFPKLINLATDADPSTPAAANEGNPVTEYQLVGLGIRTVSFLSIEVYVVGFYIAVPDIAILQEKLIHSLDLDSVAATTLVTGEKAKLKELLLDPDRGEEIWNSILKDTGVRTVFRIVPTRNTDFMHMRDGFVRGVTARSSHFASARSDDSFSDETFGQSLNEFKTVFGGTARKKIPTGETLLLTRDAQKTLTAWYEDKTGNRVKMGDVKDERVGRLLWLNYLAGKNVSSEPTRKSVVDGVMEYVERPVGTVATQVV